MYRFVTSLHMAEMKSLSERRVFLLSEFSCRRRPGAVFLLLYLDDMICVTSKRSILVDPPLNATVLTFSIDLG
jgi:hypothetical protein